jgi:hypothetical protein
MTNNPLDYIKKVFSEKCIKEKESLTIFAPAHIFTLAEDVGSHKEVVEYFNKMDYVVYLSNGIFKGFKSPKNKEITLEEFNIKNKITGELRDSLRKWRELNPKVNLAITGYNTIERGVTFNTDGFNFTHAIISNYHAKKNNKLIQVIGRTTGNKKYVGEMTIICPQEVYDKVQILVENTINLRDVNPSNYNKSDFTDSKSNIPIKVIFIDEDYRIKLFKELSKKRVKKIQEFHNHIHKILVEGVNTNKISLEDRNNVYKFNINNRILFGLRAFKQGQNVTSRRFKTFNKAFETYTCTAQQVDDNQYALDMAIDEYTHDGYINPINIAWITFRN